MPGTVSPAGDRQARPQHCQAVIPAGAREHPGDRCAEDDFHASRAAGGTRTVWTEAGKPLPTRERWEGALPALRRPTRPAQPAVSALPAGRSGPWETRSPQIRPASELRESPCGVARVTAAPAGVGSLTLTRHLQLPPRHPGGSQAQPLL